MIAVNLREGRLYYDTALKDYVADLFPFSDWVKNIRDVGTGDTKSVGEIGSHARQ